MSAEETIQKIIENYSHLEESLANQLDLQVPNHQLTTGTFRESVWKSLFEQIIPRKFCIDQGVFIIDSYGRISLEVDLAIFDEQYTPYIFNYGKIKFIPIEAVAVVIQCKSKNLDHENLEKWVQSIEVLQTSLSSVVRIMTGLVDNSLGEGSKKSQTSTRPIRILCSTAKAEKIPSLFDISLYIEDKKLKKIMPQEGESYEHWYKDLNHYKLERYEKDYRDIVNRSKEPVDKSLEILKISGKDGQENVILSLIFQLNQMLMLINNPILFPHEAYAKLFQEHLARMCTQ